MCFVKKVIAKSDLHYNIEQKLYLFMELQSMPDHEKKESKIKPLKIPSRG